MKALLFRLVGLYRRVSLLILRVRGRTPAEHHAARIVSGRCWDEFCDALKAAGAAVAMGGTPKDPLTQAEGYRYLTRLLRGGLEAFLEFGDPAYPELRRTVHETVKIGADNPDNSYYNATISGAYRYRITGNRGTVRRLSLHTQRGSYGSSGGLQPAGQLDGDSLDLDEQGKFMVIASIERPGQPAVNWLPMTDDTTLFMVRQTFGDRSNEEEAVIRIERIGDAVPPRELSAEFIDQALAGVSAFVAGTAAIFTRWSIGFAKHENELPRFDEKRSTSFGGDPEIVYYHSAWRLEPDSALVIDTVIPECDYWNFQVDNFWMESLDYRYYRIHINDRNAVLNDDGTVTIVVSHRDPGHSNWLTTAGHGFGTMCFRWIRPREAPPPQPRTRVVPLSELDT